MLLAIDLSRHAGWCCGAPAAKPSLGIWELPSMVDHGAQFSALCDVLADTITVHRPDLVLAEADVSLHRQNANSIAYQQLGMLAVCELVCWKRDVKFRVASAGEARKAVLGQSRWPKGEVKQAVLQHAWDKGWIIHDHNIADAFLLWEYGCEFLKKPQARIAA